MSEIEKIIEENLIFEPTSSGIDLVLVHKSAKAIQDHIKQELVKARIDELERIQCNCGEHIGMTMDIKMRLEELRGGYDGKA